MTVGQGAPSKSKKTVPLKRDSAISYSKSSATPTISRRIKKKHKNRNLRQIFILSFDALKERKARSALTILMVVVGAALMVALNGLSAGAAEFISKQLNFLAPNVIFVSPGQINFRGGPAPPSTIVFNSQVVDRIKSLPFVQDVVPAYNGQLELNAQGNIITTPVLATDPTKVHFIAPSMQLVPGSSIQGNNPTGMLVGDTIANPPGKSTPFVTIGQTVKATVTNLNTITGKTEQTSRSFVITGILEPTGNPQVDKNVFINTATGNTLFKKAGKYDEMVVLALSGNYVNAVQQEITNLYGPNNIGVITPKAIMQAQVRTQSGSNSFTVEIAFVALLVGAVGIVTTLYTSVNERVKEIGTMKAIGAKSWFVLSMFLSEALLIGFIGSTIGISSGVGMAYMLASGFGASGGAGGRGGGGESAPHITPIFLPNDLLYVWALSLFISLVAGVYPAWKASRLSPLEALRR